MEASQKALKLQEEFAAVCPLGTAKTFFNLGCVFEDQQNYDEAMKRYKEAYSKQRWKNQPIMADIWNSMGVIYKLQNKYSTMMPCASIKERFRARHVDVGETHSLIGDLLSDRKKYEEAQTQHSEAMSIYEDTYEEGHPKIEKKKYKKSVRIKHED